MILITGATGNNGTQIVRRIAVAGKPVRALVRDPQREKVKVEAMQQLGVDVAAGDLADPNTLSSALKNVDAALLLSPVNPNQVQLQSNFISAARNAGVPYVVKFSMIGAANDSPVPLSRWHREAEELLEQSGMQWTHIRPNDLMRYNTQLLLPSIEKEGAFYDSLGDARISMVDEDDVAEVVTRLLIATGSARGAHAGKTYTLTGPEALSFSDIARHLSTALDRPVQYVSITPQQAEEAMRKGGLPEPAVKLVSALRAYEREGHNAVLTDTLEVLLGRAPVSYAEVAKLLAETHQAQPQSTPQSKEQGA